MSKKNKIIIIALVIVITMIFFGYRETYSFTIEDLGEGSTISVEPIENFAQVAIKILGNVGSIISVVVLILLGIKYMVGSVEEKAEYKKTLFPYVLGASLLFAASAITSIIYNIAIQI